MAHNPQVGDFDFVGVSSSPVVIIRAIQLAQDGRTVAVIDEHRELGGAWRVKNHPEFGRLEIACHLIENFPGVYELLERISRVPFSPLRPQPVRISKGGKPIPYSTRAEIIGRLLRYLVMLSVKGTEQLMRRFVPVPAHGKNIVKTPLPEILWRLREHWKYRMPRVLHGTEVWGPEGGCSRFMDGLRERARAEGIQFFCDRVVHARLRSPSDGWTLYNQEGVARVVAKHLILTESVRLVLSDPIRELQLAPKTGGYWHMALGVPSAAVMGSPPYIHLRHNSQIHRITRIHTAGQSTHTVSVLLVQLRDPKTAVSRVIEELSKAIDVDVADLRCYQHLGVECSQHISASHPGTLASVKDVESLTMLRSIGDLAQCIAATEPDLDRMRRVARQW